MQETPPGEIADPLLTLERLQTAWGAIRQELDQVIFGQSLALEQMMIAMLAGGHALLVGVPGLAKTLMVRSLAQTLDLSFKRIQFTPDLMPSDITGTDVLQEDRAAGTRHFAFLPGPIFANVILADEINRTPPKTQAALLEAMQEHQVTAGGQEHRLASPFFVLATQNPIEQEGTYPLPEAQLDRFLLQIAVDYPSEEDEFQILRQTTGRSPATLNAVVGAEDWLAFQNLTRRLPVADHVIDYALRLTRATRRQDPHAADLARQYLTWGAGPRAGQALILAAKGHAVLRGQPSVELSNVQAVAPAVLRHRLLLNFHAESERKTADDLIADLLHAIPADAESLTITRRLPPLFHS